MARFGSTLLEKDMGFLGCYLEDRVTPRFSITLNLFVGFVTQIQGGKFLVNSEQKTEDAKYFF